MLRILAASFVTLLFATVPTAAADDSMSVRFSLDSHGAVVVPVTIGSAGPFNFLVDTGSNRSAVSDRVAAALGATAVARTDMVTSSGQAAQVVVRLTRLSLGGRGVDSLAAVELPESTLNLAGPHIDGVLGQDFFGSHNYTLDYRHHLLRWDAENATVAEEATRRPLIERDGRVLVELPQEGNRPVRFVPDSGADGIVLFVRQGATPLAAEPVGGTRELTTLAGLAQVTPVLIRTLKVGDIALRNQSAVSVVRDDAGAPDADGLLPLHHFASVSFNAGGFIVFRR